MDNKVYTNNKNKSEILNIAQTKKLHEVLIKISCRECRTRRNGQFLVIGYISYSK